MWPFNRRGEDVPEAVPWLRLADNETRMQALFGSSAGMNMVITRFSFGAMTPRNQDPKDIKVPTVSLWMPPGDHPLDFAHPELGFHGFKTPPTERVLRVWADDLLTISHGNAWQLVIDPAEPIDRWWLDTAFPPPGGADFKPFYAAVMVHFDDLPARGELSRDELEAAPLTMAHLEDRRG